MSAITNDIVIKTLDEIIQLKPEEFAEFLSEQNLGYLSSVKNFIQMYYEQVNVTKDSILALVHKGENMPKQDKEQAQKTLNDLYIVMQLLEDKFNITNEIINSKMNG